MIVFIDLQILSATLRQISEKIIPARTKKSKYFV